MPIVDLTDRFCSSAKAKQRTDFYDAKTGGLILRVTPNGIKTFALMFTSPAGKRARLTLGHYPRLTLARARALAVEGQGRATEGEDPRRGGTGTVAGLAEQWIAKHVRPNLRTARAVERRMRKNALPVLGNVRLEALHRRDVNAVLDAMIDRGSPVEAARCFEDLRAMLRWGVARGDLDNSPMEVMKTPATSKPRERALNDAELAALWRKLPEALPRSKATQRIVKLCLLTAARVGEVAGMRRDELDLDAGVWTIPGERSKNGHAHAVPLSAGALAVIAELPAAGGYLFPNDAGSRSLPAHAIAKTIRLAQTRFGLAQWTAHDLRRTAVTHMARLGVSPIVLGHVINHRSVTKAGVTLAVYSQYDYAKEKREALELWGAHLAAIVRGKAAKVLPMRKRGRS